MGSFSRGGALCAGMVALWGCGGGDTTGEDAGGGAPGGGSAGSSAASDAGGGHGGRDAAPPPVPGAQRFSRFVVDDAVTGPAFASAADMNGDGRLDLIVSAFGRLEGLTQPPGTVTVYLQGADARQWTPLPVITEADGVYFPNEVQPLDLDGDGDLDLILPSGFLVCAFLPGVGACGGLQWFENKGGSFAWHAVVPVGDELFYHAAVVADLDRDGRPELITVAEQRTAPDGSGDRAEIRVFAGRNSPDRFTSDDTVIGNGLGALVSAADLDADGDLDLLSGEFFAGQGASFVWYEQVGPPNAGAPAGSWTRHVVDDTRGPAIQFSRVPDLFGPGVDGFVGANHTNTAKSPPDLQASGVFAYRRPPDPRGPWSGTPISHDIVSVAGSPASPQAAPGIFGWGDADGDGDVDLLVSGDGDPRIYLLEQRAPGLFETLVLDEDMAQAGGMKIVDLDADGRAELLATAYGRNELVLYLPEAEGAHPLGVAAPPHAPAPGEVELRIDYTGALSGNLIVGLFTQWPPAGRRSPSSRSSGSASRRRSRCPTSPPATTRPSWRSTRCPTIRWRSGPKIRN